MNVSPRQDLSDREPSFLGSGPMAPLFRQQAGQRPSGRQPPAATPQGNVDRRPVLALDAFHVTGIDTWKPSGAAAVSVSPFQDLLDRQPRRLRVMALAVVFRQQVG
ncbi:MAG: hypothetical protein ACLQNE_06000 [Thermoguttaceae bacterium]